MPYDLFISCSRRDNARGRVTQLVERIKHDFAAFAGRERMPFFDQHEIQGMEDWRQRNCKLPPWMPDWPGIVVTSPPGTAVRTRCKSLTRSSSTPAPRPPLWTQHPH
jgi:hypothetical protein